MTGNTYGYSNTFAYGLAGVCATILHDLIMNPADVVKQRMQMLYSPYGSSLECARCIYRTEGMRAFYRSYTTQLASNVPYQAIHFMTYEWFQQVNQTLKINIHFLFIASQSRAQIRSEKSLIGRWYRWRFCGSTYNSLRLHKDDIEHAANGYN